MTTEIQKRLYDYWLRGPSLPIYPPGYAGLTGKPVVLEATGERFPYERAEKQE